MLFISNFVLDLINTHIIMKKYFREILFGIALLSVLVLIIMLIYKDATTFDIKTIVIGIVISVVLVFYLTGEIRTIRERRNNIPTEDEMSRRQKEMAGNRAFHASMLLWLILFIIKSYFQEIETLMGIGILGSAVLYGIYLWRFKIKGSADE